MGLILIKSCRFALFVMILDMHNNNVVMLIYAILCACRYLNIKIRDGRNPKIRVSSYPNRSIILSLSISIGFYIFLFCSVS